MIKTLRNMSIVVLSALIMLCTDAKANSIMTLVKPSDGISFVSSAFPLFKGFGSETTTQMLQTGIIGGLVGSLVAAYDIGLMYKDSFHSVSITPDRIMHLNDKYKVGLSELNETFDRREGISWVYVQRVIDLNILKAAVLLNDPTKIENHQIYVSGLLSSLAGLPYWLAREAFLSGEDPLKNLRALNAVLKVINGSLDTLNSGSSKKQIDSFFTLIRITRNDAPLPEYVEGFRQLCDELNENLFRVLAYSANQLKQSGVTGYEDLLHGSVVLAAKLLIRIGVREEYELEAIVKDPDSLMETMGKASELFPINMIRKTDIEKVESF